MIRKLNNAFKKYHRVLLVALSTAVLGCNPNSSTLNDTENTDNTESIENNRSGIEDNLDNDLNVQSKEVKEAIQQADTVFSGCYTNSKK